MAQIDDRSLDVNEHGVLRIPAELWLSILFLCRHWVLALVVTVSSGQSRDTIRLLGESFNWWVLLAELPALLFMALCFLRQPSAGSWVRHLWRHANKLGLLTIVLHLTYVAWFLSESSYWLPWPELFLVSCSLIDLAIGLSLSRSGHIQQVLKEFPVKNENHAP